MASKRQLFSCYSLSLCVLGRCSEKFWFAYEHKKQKWTPNAVNKFAAQLSTKKFFTRKTGLLPGIRHLDNMLIKWCMILLAGNEHSVQLYWVDTCRHHSRAPSDISRPGTKVFSFLAATFLRPELCFS